MTYLARHVTKLARKTVERRSPPHRIKRLPVGPAKTWQVLANFQQELP